MNPDILDLAPQFPGGPWVNHFIYGFILANIIFIFCLLLDCTMGEGISIATFLVFLIAATKKTYDFMYRGPAQGETAMVCIGKTIVTDLGPLVVLLIYFLK